MTGGRTAVAGGGGLCLLTPASRDYAFGGERLARYGKRLVGRTAETWEFSLYPERESRLAADGERLDRHLERVWGLDAAARRALPLVKLLDVQGQLPVHCHPGDAEAARLGGADPGKDEAWLVLESGPKAAVYLGFERALSDAEIAAAVETGSLRERMVRFTPRPGDVLMVPSGIAHSARDVVLWEVQQTSDRSLLAESADLWGRPLAPAAARAGLAAFLAVARRDRPSRALRAEGVLAPEAASAGSLALAGCDHFVMEAIVLEGEALLSVGAYTVVSGEVDGGRGACAGVGATFLVGPGPARVRALAGQARLLRAWSPDARAVAALRTAGRHFETEAPTAPTSGPSGSGRSGSGR